MEERAAVERLKRGDIGGLKVLVRKHHTRAGRAAYLIVRDHALAEDVAQGAFVRAYERIDQFGGAGNDGMDSTPSAEVIVAPGRDVYFGGAGDDTIGSLADGVRQGVHVRDYVFCGGGDDTDFTDETDFVASDCERVAG